MLKCSLQSFRGVVVIQNFLIMEEYFTADENKELMESGFDSLDSSE